MTKYAKGTIAVGICARSGRKMLLRDMVFDGYYPWLRVDPKWREERHPQERLPRVNDPVALYRPAPDAESRAANALEVLVNPPPQLLTTPLNGPLAGVGITSGALESVELEDAPPAPDPTVVLYDTGLWQHILSDDDQNALLGPMFTAGDFIASTLVQAAIPLYRYDDEILPDDFGDYEARFSVERILTNQVGSGSFQSRIGLHFHTDDFRAGTDGVAPLGGYAVYLQLDSATDDGFRMGLRSWTATGLVAAAGQSDRVTELMEQRKYIVELRKVGNLISVWVDGVQVMNGVSMSTGSEFIPTTRKFSVYRELNQRSHYRVSDLLIGPPGSIVGLNRPLSPLPPVIENAAFRMYVGGSEGLPRVVFGLNGSGAGASRTLAGRMQVWLGGDDIDSNAVEFSDYEINTGDGGLDYRWAARDYEVLDRSGANQILAVPFDLGQIFPADADETDYEIRVTLTAGPTFIGPGAGGTIDIDDDSWVDVDSLGGGLFSAVATSPTTLDGTQMDFSVAVDVRRKSDSTVVYTGAWDFVIGRYSQIA